MAAAARPAFVRSGSPSVARALPSSARGARRRRARARAPDAAAGPALEPPLSPRWVFPVAGGSAVLPAAGTGAPRGVVHFVGGAAVGASPQLVYALLLEELSAAGFAVVATPYDLTFRHAECAGRVAAALPPAIGALSELSAGGIAADTPVFGVGHSNGALLQLLMGATAEAGGREPYDAVVLMSFNNRQVADAIPVLPEGVLPPEVASTLAAARGTPLEGVFAAFAESARGSLPPPLAPLGEAAAPALAQFDSLAGELADGADDFVPVPQESRRIIEEGYAVEDTLVVSFKDDNLDDSESIIGALRARGGRVRALTLPGWHGAPCAPGGAGAGTSAPDASLAAAHTTAFLADAALRIARKRDSAASTEDDDAVAADDATTDEDVPDAPEQ